MEEMNMRQTLFPVFSVALALAACDNDHSLGSIGNQGPGADASAEVDAQPTTPVPNTPDARVLGPLGPVESWTGYLENYQLVTGSDVVRVSVAYDSAGQVAGTVVFGDGTPPPSATDPNVGYPPGVSGYQFGEMLTTPVVGFPYSIREGSYASSRLKVVVDFVELWADWCALQPPQTNGSPTCGPNGFRDASRTGGAGGQPCVETITTTDGKKEQYECGKFDLCIGVPLICACSPAGCSAGWGSGYTSFDMFVVDNTASGSVREPNGTYNVHLTKDP
jgi:hypothetical protein